MLWHRYVCTSLIYYSTYNSLKGIISCAAGRYVAVRPTGGQHRHTLWVRGIMDILPRQHECDVLTGSGACVIINSGTRRLSFARQIPELQVQSRPFHFGP